ncbi:hypothetical protein DY218_04190 [Streptomyces triticagri]|uniref:Carboxypeptidase regulatory-like domain-containing protein n=1 Tax=Streptomyces triticagri TaxID=2293568 RepID=A0A372MC39_9ACTN|nr:hypothetical protein [Streptomyces triticagri]RFU87963.1 hypothetical protein DY218_04190 [Streptomyces triticagri]
MKRIALIAAPVAAATLAGGVFWAQSAVGASSATPSDATAAKAQAAAAAGLVPTRLTELQATSNRFSSAVHTSGGLVENVGNAVGVPSAPVKVEVVDTNDSGNRAECNATTDALGRFQCDATPNRVEDDSRFWVTFTYEGNTVFSSSTEGVQSQGIVYETSAPVEP